MEVDKIVHGCCTQVLTQFDEGQVDLIYLDPPFFTQRSHFAITRDKSARYEFDDKHESLDQYLANMKIVLAECCRVLKSTGSIFLHCDRRASHHLRSLLDDFFGANNFQSEIVWTYRRWSRSQKGLLGAHQTIYFYSKSDQFKFNTFFADYSATTNIDQILQERKRDADGVSVYKRDASGRVVLGKEKKGVPLSDVWDIPYLNPKARERCGYPTQKPVLLLNRIVRIASDEGDVVLDPFCGSGTTCVAAKLLNRKYIGIDRSAEAVRLANHRLNEMIVSNSQLLARGKEAYLEKSEAELAILANLQAFPVQRNSGIDGFLKEHVDGFPVPVKIQRENEVLDDAIDKLEHATIGKGFRLKIVVQTRLAERTRFFDTDTDIKIVKTPELQIRELTRLCSAAIGRKLPHS
ncbi:MAG: DNA-methyltransferase [Thermoguttaceae bacterium]